MSENGDVEEYEEYEEEYEEEEFDESSESGDEILSRPSVLSFHSFRKRLVRFFTYYEPSQIKIVDQWVSNWKGRETQLFNELIKFHGPEPSSGAVLPKRGITSAHSLLLDKCLILLRQFFAFYAPERYHDAEDVLLKWKGNEKDLLQKLEEQQALRDYVIGYYRTFLPERAAEITSVLRQWLSHEEELVGHISNVEELQERDRHKSIESPIFPDSRAMLTQFFRVFNPGKISEVDTLLQVYKGREETLFRSLRRKYLHVIDDPVVDGGPSWLTTSKKEEWMTLWKLLDHAPNSDETVVELMSKESTEEEFMRALSAKATENRDVQPKMSKKNVSHCSVQTSSEDHIVHLAERVSRANERQTRVNEKIAALERDAGYSRSTDLQVPKGISSKSSSLSVFLAAHSLGELYNLLIENDIDLDVLPEMSKNELVAVGVPVHAAETVLQCAKRL